MSLRPAPPRAAQERRAKSVQRGGRLEHVLRIGMHNAGDSLTPKLHTFPDPQPDTREVYLQAVQRRDARRLLGGGRDALEPDSKYESGALRNLESHRDDLGNTWRYHVTDGGMRDRLVSIDVADKRMEAVLHGTLNMAGPAQDEQVLSYISRDATNSLVFDDNRPPRVAEMDVSIEWLRANHTAYEKLAPELRQGMQHSMMQGMRFPTGIDHTAHEEHFKNRMSFLEHLIQELPNLWKLHFGIDSVVKKNSRYSMKLKPEGQYTLAEGNIEHAALNMQVGPLHATVNFVARKGEPAITLEYTRGFSKYTTTWLEDETETPTAPGATTFHDIKLFMQQDAEDKQNLAEYREAAVRRFDEASRYIEQGYKKKLAEYTEAAQAAAQSFDEAFNQLYFFLKASLAMTFVLS